MEKKYNAPETEPQMQRLWAENSVYDYRPEAEGQVYSIDTPPPTVSGALHIGHIFSYVQAEMVARHKRLQGYNVFYPFGFDDNGLPTERLVEKEHGVKAKDLPRREFNALCMETAGRYEGEFTALWQSLGFSVDWSLQYRTISPEVRALSQRAFLDLARRGKAYERSSPVLWCCECRTSIAQAELETAEKETAYHHIPFAVGESQVVIATTRPELLYGCVCLFVHPRDERHAGLIGQTARVPLYGHEIPILAEETVEPDKGTGAVMCATYGDSADVEWCETHGLPYRRVILPDGTVDKTVPHIGGLYVKKARAEIVRLLGESGLLLKTEPAAHMVALHERCGTQVEIIPSRQWYIDILSEKERFLAAADEINWYPAHMKKRYTAWVENLKWDWCISRQRYFGVPFPVWYCAECGKAHFAEEHQLPVDPSETACVGTCACGGTVFRPETDVMDTWATSSLTPLINARWGTAGERPEVLPMSMRTQAHEIIRTWTFYTIVRCLYHTGRLPWRDIMLCGFVLAKKGEKISKSKNNAALSPEELVRVHSADAVRYWATGARLGTDTFFAAEDLSQSRRFLTKLWNAARFALSHLEDFDGGEPALLPIDRWLLARVAQCSAASAALLYRYETGLARREVDELFWQDFCDDYLEIVKERLYQPEKHGAERRRSAQYALYRGLLEILRLYAPFVPHITEAIYQQFYRGREGALSLHGTRYQTHTKPEADILAFGAAVRETVADMRRYKTEQGLSLRAELAALEVTCPPALRPWFQETEGDLMACANAGEIIYR